MMRPTYRNLERATEPGQTRVHYCSGSPAPQGNPRHYKYYWQVFSMQSPWEDHDFFQHAPVLCNAEFEQEVQRLINQDLSCLVYGFRRPRNDAANPWDMGNPKWADVQFAVSWDDDTDPIVDGGHK